jgi:DNA repair/transcription protein MET18/MMS19
VFLSNVTYTVRVLTAFYVGKLEDTETIVPALKGLLSLSLLTPFTSAEATTVVNAYDCLPIAVDYC